MVNMQYMHFDLQTTYLGDNCIQIFHLVYGRTDHIHPLMKILNMVIPILMQFLTFIRQRHSILYQM